MPKTKTIYFCQNCGLESAKWIGKCTACHQWNTFVEDVVVTSQASSLVKSPIHTPTVIQEIDSSKVNRWSSEIAELDRVLGGGIVPGSLILIGGEPGIGKSTLLIQLAIKIQKKVLYISGEESTEQIKRRADRIGILSTSCYLLAETHLEKIFSNADTLKPELIIIDSIQTTYSPNVEAAPGSISQIKVSTGEMMKYSKTRNIPIILVGHINKEGAIAGPKVLEHMVDTVLQFEGDNQMLYRMIRTIKNRFGATSELGLFEMQNTGLREITSSSEMLILPKENDTSGVAIGVSVEGNRPLLIENQALVSPSNYGHSQRSVTGYDANRINMLLAVMEKRAGLKLINQDVFINLVGGMKIQDTALDLAICMAIYSSYTEKKISTRYCFASEIGLGGEMRAVPQIDRRIAEAQKLNYEKIFISKYQKSTHSPKNQNIAIEKMGKISEVFQFFG